MLLSIEPPVLGLPDELLSYSVTFAESVFSKRKKSGRPAPPHGWTNQHIFCLDNVRPIRLSPDGAKTSPLAHAGCQSRLGVLHGPCTLALANHQIGSSCT